MDDIEHLIVTEVVEHLAEAALDYVLDQVASLTDDREEEQADFFTEQDVGPVQRYESWEEFIGLEVRPDFGDSVDDSDDRIR